MLRESGTDDARELYTAATWIQSSRLLVPESRAALARAIRVGRLSARSVPKALGLASELLAQVEPIEVDALLATSAGELAEAYALRAYDAVHLASYQQVEAQSSVLVAADGDLVRAARAIGHAVAVPGA